MRCCDELHHDLLGLRCRFAKMEWNKAVMCKEDRGDGCLALIGTLAYWRALALNKNSKRGIR